APSEELRWSEDVAAAGAMRALFPQHDDAAWIAKRQPLQQHRVDDREDGRVRADAERKRQHGDEREARRTKAETDGVTDVLKGSVHEAVRSLDRPLWLSREGRTRQSADARSTP